MRKDPLLLSWERWREEFWRACSLPARSFQTPTTLMCVNRRTREQWLDDCGISHFTWYTSLSQNKPVGATVKDSSSPKCQQSQSLILSLEIIPDKKDLRCSFSLGGTREHIIHWWDELTVFYQFTVIPQADHQNAAVWGNYGKCIQIHVRWVIFRWKTRELSWGLFVNTHRSVVWRKLPNCWLNEESEAVMGALGKRMSQTLHHTQLAQEVDQFHQEPAHSLKH